MNLLKASFSITVIALVSRLFGLGRDVALVWLFGATLETDAFFAAFAVIYPAYIVISTSLASGSVRFMTTLTPSEGEERGRHFLSIAMNLTALGMLVLAGALVVGADTIAQGLAGRGNAALASRIETTLLFLAPAGVLMGLSGILAGYLQYRLQFVRAALAPAVLNLSILALTIGLGGWLGVQAAVAGALAGAVVLFAMQLPSLNALPFKQVWSLRLHRVLVAEFFAPVSKIILSALLLYAFVFVDLALAAGLGEGKVTVFSIATKFIQLPQGMIAIGVTVSAFPVIAGLLQSRQDAAAGDIIAKVNSGILLLSMIAASGLFAVGDAALTALFRGTLSAAAQQDAARILLGLTLTIPALALNTFLVRVSFAQGQFLLPVALIFGGLMVKALAGFALVGLADLHVFALSSALGLYAVTLALMLSLGRGLPELFNGVFWFSTARMTICALAITLSAAVLDRTIPPQAALLEASMVGLWVLVLWSAALALFFRPQMRGLLDLRRIKTAQSDPV